MPGGQNMRNPSCVIADMEPSTSGSKWIAPISSTSSNHSACSHRTWEDNSGAAEPTLPPWEQPRREVVVVTTPAASADVGFRNRPDHGMPPLKEDELGYSSHLRPTDRIEEPRWGNTTSTATAAPVRDSGVGTTTAQAHAGTVFPSGEGGGVQYSSRLIPLQDTLEAQQLAPLDIGRIDDGSRGLRSPSHSATSRCSHGRSTRSDASPCVPVSIHQAVKKITSTSRALELTAASVSTAGATEDSQATLHTSRESPEAIVSRQSEWPSPASVPAVTIIRTDEETGGVPEGLEASPKTGDGENTAERLPSPSSPLPVAATSPCSMPTALRTAAAVPSEGTVPCVSHMPGEAIRRASGTFQEGMRTFDCGAIEVDSHTPPPPPYDRNGYGSSSPLGQPTVTNTSFDSAPLAGTNNLHTAAPRPSHICSVFARPHRTSTGAVMDTDVASSVASVDGTATTQRLGNSTDTFLDTMTPPVVLATTQPFGKATPVDGGLPSPRGQPEDTDAAAAQTTTEVGGIAFHHASAHVAAASKAHLKNALLATLVRESEPSCATTMGTDDAASTLLSVRPPSFMETGGAARSLDGASRLGSCYSLYTARDASCDGSHPSPLSAEAFNGRTKGILIPERTDLGVPLTGKIFATSQQEAAAPVQLTSAMQLALPTTTTAPFSRMSSGIGNHSTAHGRSGKLPPHELLSEPGRDAMACVTRNPLAEEVNSRSHAPSYAASLSSPSLRREAPLGVGKGDDPSSSSSPRSLLNMSKTSSAGSAAARLSHTSQGAPTDLGLGTTDRFGQPFTSLSTLVAQMPLTDLEEAEIRKTEAAARQRRLAETGCRCRCDQPHRSRRSLPSSVDFHATSASTDGNAAAAAAGATEALCCDPKRCPRHTQGIHSSHSQEGCLTRPLTRCRCRAASSRGSDGGGSHPRSRDTGRTSHSSAHRSHHRQPHHSRSRHPHSASAAVVGLDEVLSECQFLSMADVVAAVVDTSDQELQRARAHVAASSGLLDSHNTSFTTVTTSAAAGYEYEADNMSSTAALAVGGASAAGNMSTSLTSSVSPAARGSVSGSLVAAGLATGGGPAHSMSATDNAHGVWQGGPLSEVTPLTASDALVLAAAMTDVSLQADSATAASSSSHARTHSASTLTATQFPSQPLHAPPKLTTPYSLAEPCFSATTSPPSLSRPTLFNGKSVPRPSVPAMLVPRGVRQVHSLSDLSSGALPTSRSQRPSFSGVTTTPPPGVTLSCDPFSNAFARRSGSRGHGGRGMGSMSSLSTEFLQPPRCPSSPASSTVLPVGSRSPRTASGALPAGSGVGAAAKSSAALSSPDRHQSHSHAPLSFAEEPYDPFEHKVCCMTYALDMLDDKDGAPDASTTDRAPRTGQGGPEGQAEPRDTSYGFPFSTRSMTLVRQPWTKGAAGGTASPVPPQATTRVGSSLWEGMSQHSDGQAMMHRAHDDGNSFARCKRHEVAPSWFESVVFPNSTGTMDSQQEESAPYVSSPLPLAKREWSALYSPTSALAMSPGFADGESSEGQSSGANSFGVVARRMYGDRHVRTSQSPIGHGPLCSVSTAATTPTMATNTTTSTNTTVVAALAPRDRAHVLVLLVETTTTEGRTRTAHSVSGYSPESVSSRPASSSATAVTTPTVHVDPAGITQAADSVKARTHVMVCTALEDELSKPADLVKWAYANGKLTAYLQPSTETEVTT